VPNAFFFLDKYTQVAPLTRPLDSLNSYTGFWRLTLFKCIVLTNIDIIVSDSH